MQSGSKTLTEHMLTGIRTAQRLAKQLSDLLLAK